MLEGVCFALSMESTAGVRAVCRASAALAHPQHGRHRRIVAKRQLGTAAAASRSRRLPAGTSITAERGRESTPGRLTVSDRIPAPPAPEVEVRVIGIGSRGASAITKLVEHGKVGAGCSNLSVENSVKPC